MLYCVNIYTIQISIENMLVIINDMKKYLLGLTLKEKQEEALKKL